MRRGVLFRWFFRKAYFFILILVVLFLLSTLDNISEIENHHLSYARLPLQMAFTDPLPDINPAVSPILDYRSHFMTHYPIGIKLRSFVDNYLAANISIPFPVINPHPYNYTIRSKDCRFTTNKYRKLLILVKSAAAHFDLRLRIRQKWGNVDRKGIHVVFLLGYVEHVQAQVQLEADLHKDIVQQNFIDAYLNNTLKTTMAYQWANDHCASAKFVLHVDDDFHVNVDNLVSLLKGVPFTWRKVLYLGFVIGCGQPYRGSDSKWQISKKDYPFDLFPPYLAGGAYITSDYVVKMFHTTIPYVKPIRIDDVYLGFIAKKLSIIPIDDVNFHTGGPYMRKYLFKMIDNNGNDKHFESEEELKYPITPPRFECFV